MAVWDQCASRYTDKIEAYIRECDMKQFTLIGYPTLIFNVVWRGEYAGIDCVKGVTLDGKRQTLARVADVELVQ